jgi:hypothetical protein
MSRTFRAGFPAGVVAAALLALPPARADAQGQGRSFPTAPLTYPTPMDPDDIAGVVTSLQGAEAGVWVIAETTDLKTKFVRIVVTNDEGRYVLPDLPKAAYHVFVRGYGLADSKRMKAWPGQQLFFGVTAAAPPDAAQQRPEGLERNVVITMWDGDEARNEPHASSGSARVQSTAGGAWSTVRVPYPEEFVARVEDERVEDDKAGWKGRSLRALSPGRRLAFQVRPDPLAR